MVASKKFYLAPLSQIEHAHALLHTGIQDYALPYIPEVCWDGCGNHQIIYSLFGMYTYMGVAR